jgi:hypothetical protein
MAATIRKTTKSPSASEACSKTIFTLSREASALKRQLSSLAKEGAGFSRAMEKIEDQLHFAKKRLSRPPTDFDLNETAILAEKVSLELESLVPSSYGAAVLSEARRINREFLEVRVLLARMRAQSSDIEKKARRHREEPGKIALLSFANHAKLCKEKLSRLSAFVKPKESREYVRLFSALGTAEDLSVRAEEQLIRMTKSRLKGKIGAAKSEIMGFMRRSGSGRVFLDHKHLTLRSGQDCLTLSFSPEVKYCLEEIAPISVWLENIGKNAVLVGSFTKQDGGALLKIGERAVVGNSIVYRECSVLLN